MLAFFCKSYLYLPISIILQTGGLAFGEISIKSKPSSLANSMALLRGKVPRFPPSLPITCTSKALILSLALGP